MAADLYQVLGIERGADDAAIKKAYKRLAMRYHPDRNQSPDAEVRFKEVQQAYGVLSDPTRRDNYDRFGTIDADAAPPSGFDDITSIFGGIFGGSFGRGSRQEANTGRSLKVALDISLEDAVTGGTHDLNIPMHVACAKCDGQGARDRNARKQCPRCHGHGVVTNNVAFLRLEETCGTCRGSGEVITDPCRTCDGAGRVRDNRKVSVDLPAGLDDGDTLRVRGKGEAGRAGAPAGDLLVQVRLRPHRVFTRHGDNLACEMPVSFTTAALGGKVEIPTLDGPKNMDLPKGIQSGRKFKVKGAGIRGMRSRVPGDLILTIIVETPQKLNADQTRLLRELEVSLEGDDGKHTPSLVSWLRDVKEYLVSK